MFDCSNYRNFYKKKCVLASHRFSLSLFVPLISIFMLLFFVCFFFLNTRCKTKQQNYSRKKKVIQQHILQKLHPIINRLCKLDNLFDISLKYMHGKKIFFEGLGLNNRVEYIH